MSDLTTRNPESENFDLFLLNNSVRKLDVLSRRLALSVELFEPVDLKKLCALNQKALETLLVCTRNYEPLAADAEFKPITWLMGVKQMFESIVDELPNVLLYDLLSNPGLPTDRHLLIHASVNLSGFYIRECLAHLSRLPEPVRKSKSDEVVNVMSAQDALRQPYQRTDRNLPR